MQEIYTFATASTDPYLHRIRELELDFIISSEDDNEGKEEPESNQLPVERGTLLLERGIYLWKATNQKMQEKTIENEAKRGKGGTIEKVGSNKILSLLLSIYFSSLLCCMSEDLGMNHMVIY